MDFKQLINEVREDFSIEMQKIGAEDVDLGPGL